MALFEPYSITVVILGLTGLLFLIQLLVFDVMSIKSGRIPGTSVEQNHKSFLFRSCRAFENSNESVGILLLLTAFGLLSSADADWLNTAAVVYFSGRVFHMIFYYLNQKVLRSVGFGVSVLGLFGIFLSGALTWI